MTVQRSFEPLLLTIDEAATALRLSKGTVKKLIRSDALTSVKIGVSRRVPADALVEYVARLKNEAASAQPAESPDRSAA